MTELPSERGINFPLSSTSDLDAFDQVMEECEYQKYQSAKNYASYSTREMGGYSDKLLDRFKNFNFVDQSLPPRAFGIETKCIDMLSELWNAPDPENVFGLTTTGSSEACILAGLSLKQVWQNKKKQTGKPNLVISSEYHVTWEKFCYFFDVEMRAVPITRKNLSLDVDHAISMCDENTIGVVAILGSSGIGLYDNVELLNSKIDTYNLKTGYDINIHVDAASGGFYAPFMQPDLVWDFQLEWVTSINASGHKFGLVYPSVGWALWKNKECFPSEMKFSINYIGGIVKNMSLNFSKPLAHIIAQYYQFKSLGKEGYTKSHTECSNVATFLNEELEKMGCFDIINNGEDLPVVCWGLKHEATAGFNLFELSDKLKEHGWYIPAYTLPSNLENNTVQRIVITSDIDIPEVKAILKDMAKSLKALSPAPKLAMVEA